MNETADLAKFVADLKYEDLPAELSTQVENLLLDQFAAQLCASVKPWSKAVFKYARDQESKRESTIVNYGDKVTVEYAAFVNASFGRGFEIDDTHRPSLSHPATVIIPSALAMGERELIDGKSFILAIVLGYEAMGRVGRAVAPTSVDRGFDPTSIAGPFGAAATAGKILGFTQTQMINAFGIAASQSSGLMEFASSGGHTVRMHPGIAAQGGIRSALLAQRGLLGPQHALEGENGFCKAFSNAPRLEDITADFRHYWVAMDIVYKKYHTDYFLQAPIEAALKLVREHSFNPSEIEQVVVGSNRLGPRIIGTMNDPKDVTSCHFSAAFCLGMSLVKGSNSYADFTDESLADPTIREMARKVTVEIDADVDALYPAKRAGKVTIKMKNGEIYQEMVIDAKGTHANPMSRSELEDKFTNLASIVLPDRQIEEIVTALRNLPDVRDVTTLSRLLVRP